MIERDGELITSINPGDRDYGVAGRVRQYSYTGITEYLDCTDTTARYIEKLPEIVELLKEFASWQSHGYLEGPFKKCQAIITYAEGNDGLNI